MFFVANMSAIAVEKYNFNTFSNCEEVYFDADDNGAFAFAYNGKTVYTQSFVPTIKSYSFTVDGGFVGVPFIDKDTVCAVYMTNDFKYRIVRINCFDGRVSYVNSDVLDDFNYTDISICNNRLYVMKTDEVYCYVSAYDFNGKHLSDYRFSEKNVNAITTNNGSAYVFLYDGSVYRLDENKAEYCTRVRDCSDFYNSGAGFLSDSRGYIYSLNENKEYTNIKLEIQEGENLFEKINIEKQIAKSQNRKVWLKCGGFITIDKTEALTAIDVNTGKYTGNKNLEQTVFKVNKEATIEIAKQIRLRDIGGIIIIDYIDMKKQEDREQIEEILREELKKDRTKTQVEGFTNLDLMELTRKHICSHKG